MSQAIERFRTLLRIPTISRLDESAIDWHRFEEFRATLVELYPLTHKMLELELIAGHSMLYRWRGVTSGAPAVLMAHYDVVPASDDGWEHPPCAAELTGENDDRELWGRGTLDDKGALATILEAVESSLAGGFTPEGDVYLSFGHNEETTG